MSKQTLLLTIRTKKLNTRAYAGVVVAVFGVIGFLLMAYLELPMPGFPVFLKFDLSLLPALIAGFTLGLEIGTGVVIIKSILYVLFSGKGGGDMGVGVLMSALADGAFVLVATSIYHRFHTKIGAIFSLIIGTLSVALIMVAMNSLVINLLINVENINKFLWEVIFPFNLLKGGLTSFITFIIYKKISYFLKGKCNVVS